MKSITLQELQKFGEEEYVYVDIRGAVAYEHGHIPGAVCWSPGEMPDRLPKDRKLIIYCSVGENSVETAQELQKQGYEAYSLRDGYRAWLLRSFDELNPHELEKYDRQIILPQVGTQGQKRLKEARVLIVGAGGLGAPAALYLAGAGVGKIGIIDADAVNISNLHRQIIHAAERVGMNKAESAGLTIKQHNELVQVETYPCFLTAENAEQIIGGYDFIIDAVDHIETKFLINDACVLLKKPFCHAGVLQFHGQVMTWTPGGYPCYRCIFEEIPEAGTIPGCSQTGVMGAVAGIIGSMQALEAIKYILGTEGLLTGKMLIFDGLTMNTRLVTYKNKNRDCRVCGERKQIFSVRENAEEYKTAPCLI